MSTLSSDRRDFLKSAGAAAGIAATAGLSGAYAAGDENIKVGVIGCGGRGNGAIRNILDADPKVEIVAFGDVFEGQAKGSYNNWKNNKTHGARIKATPDAVFSGLDAYKKVLAADIDLVILATPPGFRPIHLEAAVNSSKKIHIFCEKPVAVDAAGIRKCLSLVEASKAKNIGIVAGTQRRHQKGYIETIQKLQNGAIGEVVSARCAWNSGGSPPIWFKDRLPGEPDATYQIRNWYHFMWVCGDHIVEQHVHNLDVINWIMGSHPIRATGMGGRATRKIGNPNEVGNIFDHFAVEYEYKNGVKLFSYCRHIAGTDSDVSETVFCQKGVCKVNAYEINKEKVGEDNRDAYVQEHMDLIASIRSGKPLNELQAVTESTFTAILGRNATYAGKWLTWDNALAANDESMPAGLTLDAKLSVNAAPVPGAWKLPAKVL